MPRTKRILKNKATGVSVRRLKKELKLIPNDIKREMRFLDLLFSERNQVRTETEKEVLGDFIQTAKKMVEFHQNRLERYQECYKQIKSLKSFEQGLLFPDELAALQKTAASSSPEAPADPGPQRLRRTGTDG